MNPWAQAARDFWVCIAAIGTAAVIGIVCQVVSILREDSRTRRILDRRNK